jgi:hypothetical protein
VASLLIVAATIVGIVGSTTVGARLVAVTIFIVALG